MDPNAYKVADHEPGSPEWLNLRRNHLGASEAGTLIGAGFLNWNQLVAEKANPGPRRESSAMFRGNVLEPACMELARLKGYPANPELHGTWRNDNYPWWSVNHDGISDDGVVIEAKSTAMRDKGRGWGRGGTAQIPLGYLAQVTVQCGIIGADRWVMPVIATKVKKGRERGTVESDFSIALYKGRFDAKLFAELNVKAEQFMQDLDAYRSFMLD